LRARIRLRIKLIGWARVENRHCELRGIEAESKQFREGEGK
jgi:hypothetical protein